MKYLIVIELRKGTRTVEAIRTSLRRRLPYPSVFVMLNDMATAPNDLAGH